MLRVKMLLAMVFGLVILSGVAVALADELETTTIDGVEFHLVPEEWVVNYAHNFMTNFWKGQGIGIGENYLAIPVYGMEDQIISYVVLFSIGDSVANSLDDLHKQQYEDNKPLLNVVDYYLNGQIDHKYLAAEMGKNISGLYMNNEYAGGVYLNLLELGPKGKPTQGIPPEMAFYWLATKYLENKYKEEPVFKCFRKTEELGFCYEFTVGDKDVLVSMDPYFWNTKIMDKDQCHTKSYSHKYDAKKVEENTIEWEQYAAG